MSESELAKNVFSMHKEWVEDGIAGAKEAANDCNIPQTLEHFYRAILALKGLESVFTIDVPEVNRYINQRKQDITKKEIPEIANILKIKCRIP